MGEFGKLNFSVSFNRTSAFPIEANGYFESLVDAQAAASTAVEVGSAESTYYIGQTLTVVEGDKATNYTIQPDKTLKEVGDNTDYTDLINKPQINNVELSGNKTLLELGIQPAGEYALKKEIPDTSQLATKTELKSKQDILESGTNIKTINGESILGEGDITVESGSGVGKVDPNSDGTGEIFNNYENNKATGQYSHAEGNRTKANGNYSHAEGVSTKANGNYSHAEGSNTEASGKGSHAEGICSGGGGYYITASGYGSHAEGYVSVGSGGIEASGKGSHAEGCIQSGSTGVIIEASGIGSHAEGLNMFNYYHMIAQGDGSHIQNVGTVAKNYGQTSMGCFNEDDEAPKSTSYDASKPALIIGNGTSSAAGNAFKVLFNGKTFADGEYSGAGADYAEMFEWKDGNPNNEDRVGRFVTLENDKIRLAKFTDSYILGIVSGAPTIIGDNPMRWQGKYLNDEWGRPIYEDIEVTYKEFEKQEDRTEIEVEKTRIDRVRKLNPEYNPKEKYVPRTERPEWDYVGMMGKLLVKQDGTLVAGGFCKSGDDGVATKAESGYYVMKVINENQALILFK